MQLGFVYIYIRYYTINININNTPLTVCHLYWQGYMDEDRTFYSVSENAILGGENV